MRYFPIFLDMKGQTVLVVGGDEQAAQKIRLLRKSEACVRVVATDVIDEIDELERRGRIEIIRRSFHTSDLDGIRLVVASPSIERQILERLALTAKHRGIPVNVVDEPELGSFITPAIVDRDPIVCAIGSEGTAPVLARRIREMLEAYLPSGLGTIARRAGQLRPWVATMLDDARDRRRFWDGFFRAPIAHQEVPNGAAADEIEILEQVRKHSGIGKVILVGAGPGDPDLLTIKALRTLQEADVVVHDRLIGPGIIERARRDAERVDVGKRPGYPSTKQSEICQILIDQARQGKTVVRLKGGDPLVFGRAAEELEAVRRAGIEVEIVPGITAALASAAVAKVTLTERLDRRRLTLLTGHATDGPATHDWRALAQSGQALAIYMGVGSATHIERHLLDNGADPSTPVTLVENATLPNQKIAVGMLSGLTETVIDHAIKGPAIIFIGTKPAQITDHLDDARHCGAELEPHECRVETLA